MGRVDLVSGDAAVDFVMDPTGADDAKDNVHVRLQRFLSQLVQDSAEPRGHVHIHLPVGFLTDFRYYQVARWAIDRGLAVWEDMPPAFFADALPVVEHHRLALRAGERQGSPTTSASVSVAGWLAQRKLSKEGSGPVPGH